MRSLTWRLGPLSTVVAAAAMVRVHTYHTSARSYTAVMLWQARTLLNQYFCCSVMHGTVQLPGQCLSRAICTQYMS